MEQPCGFVIELPDKCVWFMCRIPLHILNERRFIFSFFKQDMVSVGAPG